MIAKLQVPNTSKSLCELMEKNDLNTFDIHNQKVLMHF